MDFSGIIHKIRNGLDTLGGDIGSFFSGGQPQHIAPTPAPMQQPQAPQFRVPQQQFSPGQSQFRMTPPTSSPFAPSNNTAGSLPNQQPKPLQFKPQPTLQSAPQPPQPMQQPPKPPANPFPNVDAATQQTINNSVHLNPTQKQAMLQRLNQDAPVQFNPVKAAFQSAGEGALDIGKGIGDAVVNTAKVPIDAAILGGSKIAGNKDMANAAQQQLGEDAGNNMFNNPLQQKAGQLLATAIYQPTQDANMAKSHADTVNTIASAYGNTPAARNYAEMVASANDQQIYDTELAQQGLTPNSSLPEVAWRTGAPVVAALTQDAAMLTGGGEGASAVEQGLLPVLKTANTYGAINAATGVLGTAADPNATPTDYLKAAGTGYVGGISMPLAGAGLKAGLPVVANYADTAIRTNAPRAVAALHNVIQSLPNFTRTVAVKAAASDKPVVNLPASSLTPTDMTGYGELDPQRVAYYKQQIQSGAPVDPILAMRANDGSLFVEDGKHRLAAMKELGAQNVPVQIVTPEDISRIAQGGYVGLPQRGAANAGSEPTNTPKANDAASEETLASQPNHQDGSYADTIANRLDPFVEEYAAEHTPAEIAKEHAAMMRSLDQGAQGGVMVENNNGTGALTYSRTTEHTPFYSNYFAENGRAPSQAAYLEQAIKELESGKGDMLDPGMADAYQLAKQREDEANQYATTPNPEIEQASYYFGPNKNGGAFSKEDIAALFGEPKSPPPAAPMQPHETNEEDVNRVHAANPLAPENAVREEDIVKPVRSVDRDREAQYILQNGGTPDEAANVYVEAGKDYGDALREVSRVAQESGIDLGAKDVAQNPLFKKVALPEAKNWKQAVLNADAITKNITDLHNNVMEQAQGISQHDLELLDRTRNEPVEQLAREADKPEQFIRVAAAAKNLNDYTQEVGRMTGQQVAYRPSYGARMFYDLTDPESAKAYEAYKAALKTRPGYGQRRGISSYQEAASLGIKRAHANYIQDLMHDAVSRGNDLSKLALAKGLGEAYPKQVRIGEIGKTPEGTYEQLRIPHGQDISMPKEIADEINHRAQYAYSRGALGKMLRGYDTFNGATKFFRLALGGFHNVVELSAFTARSLLHGDFRGIAKNVDTIFRKGAFEREMSRFQRNGTLEKAHFAGLTTGASDITSDSGGKVRIIERGKYNPIRVFHDALFQRQIPYAKLRIFEDETKGLSLNNPDDVAKMRLTAKALNDAFGGINRLVDGITPRQAKMFSRAVLALDYNEGQVRSLVNALSKGGPQGRIARQVVVGRMVLLALPGIVVYSLQPGAKNDPVDLAKRILDQVLDPHVPSPFKTASGIPKEIELPVNAGGKLERSVAPFLDSNQPDKFSGIKHEISGNTASGLSTLNQIVTNQDYYGNPIITTDANTGKIKLGQSAANIASEFEPISGGQVIKAATGQESPAEAAVNIMGGRTVADPDDPRMQILDNRNKVVGGLSQQDQSALLGVHPSWGNLPKDQQDNIYTNPHYEEQKWDTMLSNQKVYDALRTQDAFAAQHGQPANPLLSLNPQDAKTIMTYEWLKHADPGSDANNSAAVIYNEHTPLIQKFEQDYANYGQQMNQLYQQSGGLKGDNSPVLQVGGVPQYHPDQATQNLVNQYYSLTDPKQRVQFLNDNPQLNNYFEAYFQAENQERASLNEPLMKDYPQADQATQNFMNQYTAASKATRTGMRNSNPQLYQKMQSYMEQVDAYNVAKYAGQAQFQGQDFNQKVLKGIYGLGNFSMVQNPDGTYALAGTSGAQAGATKVGGSSGSSSSESKRKATNYLRYRPHLRPLRTPGKPYVQLLKQEKHLDKGDAGYRIVPEGKFTGVTTSKGIKNIRATKGTGIKAYKVV